MEALRSAFEDAWSEWLERAPEFVLAALVLLTMIGIGRLVSRGVQRLLESRGQTSRHRKLPPRLIRWSFFLLGLILALQVLGLTGLAGSMLATGGLLAIVLGFAFREIGENLLAGLLLSFNRSFEVGDIIESGGLKGKVRGIDIRTVHIRSSDGADIFIPNAQIVSNPLFNFTRDGLRRGSFKVGIDYGDDSSKARSAVLAAVRGVPGVLSQPDPTVQVSALQPQFQELTVSFWIDVLVDGINFATVQTDVIEAARNALDDAGFTFSANVATSVELAPVTLSQRNEEPRLGG